MELTEVRGGPNITGFTVTGVFVDSYFPSFTLTGESSGPIRYQSQSTQFAGVMGDQPGPWQATGAAGNMVANPGAGMVWAYHVAAADLPRFIIRLENVQTTTGPQAGVRYVTVTGYSSGITRFERGRIYQIPAITFTETQTAATPNPANVPVTVVVRMVDWIPTQLTPVI
jgi:hypothetical protein